MIIPTPLDDAGTRALDLVRHQFNENWEAVRAQLGAASHRPDARAIAATWAEALRLVGELHAVEEPELHLRPDLSLVVDVPLHFARGDLAERITFDAGGQVSDVALLLQPLHE